MELINWNASPFAAQVEFRLEVLRKLKTMEWKHSSWGAFVLATLTERKQRAKFMRESSSSPFTQASAVSYVVCTIHSSPFLFVVSAQQNFKLKTLTVEHTQKYCATLTV